MEQSEHQDFDDAVDDVLAADIEVSLTSVENLVFGDDTLATRKRKERQNDNSNDEDSSEDEEELSRKRHKTIGEGVGRLSRDLDCPHCGHKASSKQGLAEHIKKDHPMRQVNFPNCCSAGPNYDFCQMLLDPRGSNELALLPAVPFAEVKLLGLSWNLVFMLFYKKKNLAFFLKGLGSSTYLQRALVLGNLFFLVLGILDKC